MTREAKKEEQKKNRVLTILAGKSDFIMNIGNIDFMMAPITMREYIDYEILKEQEPTTEQQAEWLAEKLRARVLDPREHDPATVTAEWVMANVPMVLLGTLRYVLLNGELPTPSVGDGNPKG